ncbi:hypothetical protein [Streptomyces sp. NPDC051567]|uniref:hypothetical protein n=1 Tax=Streptomyces sp. NPDC051567 TaxID=3365660 RepID=UPI00379EED1C
MTRFRTARMHWWCRPLCPGRDIDADAAAKAVLTVDAQDVLIVIEIAPRRPGSPTAR